MNESPLIFTKIMINPNRREQRSMMKPSERNGAKSKPTPAPAVKKCEQIVHTPQSPLQECEQMILSGFRTMAAGVARIKNEHLYREAGFSAFEEYCERRWAWSARRAYQLADAHATIKSLPEDCEPLVHNEGQARALGKVPEEKRAEVLKEVAESGPVTAKRISEAAEKNGHKATPQKVIELDKTGYPIPDSILEDWQEANSFESLIKDLYRIKLRVEKGIDEGELVFRELSNSLVADLKNAWSDLQRVIPYAVCPTCQGHGRSKCTTCKQRGFISRFGYEHWIPKDARKVREAAIKK